MNGAIVVGCAGYEDPDLAPLRYAHRDARRLAEALVASCDVTPDTLVAFHDDAPDPRRRPTRTNVLRALTDRSWLDRVDGVLFFFFSGHGFQTADGAQYLLPIDCVRGALADTSLRFDTVVRHLGGARADHSVLLLDACRNVVEGGKAAADAPPRLDVAALCPPGMVTFCSCRPGQVSYEAESLQGGVFTEALCEALGERGRCRTIYELDGYVTARVPEIARAAGRPVQRPYSRVEPLDVQRLEIVSARRSNEWRAATPIGAERRSGRAPRIAADPPRDPLVAVDFGTSYSAVSWSDGETVLLPGTDGRALVPSVVHFLPGLDYLVGSAAVEADQYRPEGTVKEAKRLLGTDRSFAVDGRSVAPELAASLVIRSLRRNAEEALGTPVRRCVASYPANFGIVQRNALARAFELAGFDVARLVAEPNVAAMSLARIRPDWHGTCAVVDLGGGTFDVAFIDYDGNDEYGELVSCVVLSSAGSDKVGGLDFDRAVVRYALGWLRDRWGPDAPRDPHLGWQLRREAQRAKRALGAREETSLLLQDVEVGDRGLHDISIPLDRDVFRRLTAPLNEEIRSVLEQAKRAWRASFLYDPDAPPLVLLAGQGTKIFTVREQLAAADLGGEVVDHFQETAVVQGLGSQAGVLTGTVKNTLLLDLTRRGIGVRCADRRGDPPLVTGDPAADREIMPVVEPFTTIPTKRTESVRLAPPGGASPRALQVALQVVEYLGEDVEVVGTVPVETGPRGRIVEVTVDIDANATIAVSVPGLDGRERHRQLNNFFLRRQAGPASAPGA
ncbi:Hsp70 family protein [Actinomadura chibensis]|uniref:Hsp70 family protein n=1 Tax=Actinomadura chibensis TaxID=392828 RepID=UPI000837626E|nr:Hsp70 family protein [Actinomadura chibensis]